MDIENIAALSQSKAKTKGIWNTTIRTFIGLCIITFVLMNYIILSRHHWSPFEIISIIESFHNSEENSEMTNRLPFKIIKNIEPKGNNQKIVLLWTDFFHSNWKSHFTSFGNRQTVPGSDDPMSNQTCFFTMDRSTIKEAEALIFHGRNFNFNDLPNVRAPNQRWIFYLMESPHNSGFSDASWAAASHLQFNWTMTFRPSSDVWIPYVYFKQRNNATRETLLQIESSIKHYSEEFANRTTDSFWFVSNCKTPSRREEIANKLAENNVTLKKFGSCSGISPEKAMHSMNEEDFIKQFRYYYSFENSLCDDYVTEKFGRGMTYSLRYGIIPIAYGAKDYKFLAPPGSLIQAEDFKSVSELAEYLKQLKSSPERVASYFQWHREYEYSTSDFPVEGFTRLCKKLFRESATNCRADNKGMPNGKSCQNIETTVDNLKLRLGLCRTPFLV